MLNLTNWTMGVARQCAQVDCGEWSAFQCAEASSHLGLGMSAIIICAGVEILILAYKLPNDTPSFGRLASYIFGVSLLSFGVYLLLGWVFG